MLSIGTKSTVTAALVMGSLLGSGTAALAESTPDAPPLVPGTPCTVTAKACVSLSAQRAWLVRDGQVYYGEASALGGRPETPTPTGTFRVEWKDKDHVSGEFNAPMPNSVFFAPGGIAFHQGSLTEMSAGCVHLSKKSSQVFFDRLNPGDEVQVVA
ncbi:L,D-transpeptidase [Saccharopolyspora taberi]|uniref:L,D-transpeptidase n=1 Tax=Saccharopolyspora taberi TaxID=60895 RepID=A0ABN3VH81_9PSEU